MSWTRKCYINKRNGYWVRRGVHLNSLRWIYLISIKQDTPSSQLPAIVIMCCKALLVIQFKRCLCKLYAIINCLVGEFACYINNRCLSYWQQVTPKHLRTKPGTFIFIPALIYYISCVLKLQCSQKDHPSTLPANVVYMSDTQLQLEGTSETDTWVCRKAWTTNRVMVLF